MFQSWKGHLHIVLMPFQLPLSLAPFLSFLLFCIFASQSCSYVARLFLLCASSCLLYSIYFLFQLRLETKIVTGRWTSASTLSDALQYQKLIIFGVDAHMNNDSSFALRTKCMLCCWTSSNVQSRSISGPSLTDGALRKIVAIIRLIVSCLDKPVHSPRPKDAVAK